MIRGPRPRRPPSPCARRSRCSSPRRPRAARHPSAPRAAWLTRSIWTSRGSCSLPTPTVKTGSFCAFIASSAGSIETSLVSAPSEIIMTPATGSPASSSRAPSSAAPSLVCGPLKFISPAEDPIRVAVDEKRKTRTRNRSDRAFSSGLSGRPNCSLTKAPLGFPPQSGICMLRESSRSTATTFC